MSEHDAKVLLALHEQRIERLEEELAKLKGSLNKGLWIIGGVPLAGIVSWIIKGGLFNGS